jgi:hypothetical protein
MPKRGRAARLDKVSEHLLDRWMEDNLCVAWQLRNNPDDYERELIRRWEPPPNCDKKVCPLNAQQLLVLDRREMFKAYAARLAGIGWITDASLATTTRDLADLVEKGALIRTG